MFRRKPAPATVTVDSLSLFPSPVTPASAAYVILRIHSSANLTVQRLVVAVRGPGANMDFPVWSNVTLTATAQTFTTSNQFFPAGDYTYFASYQTSDNVWHALPPTKTFTSTAVAPPPPPPGNVPWGPPASPAWTQIFADEFNGTAVDRNVWTWQSTAEGDWNYELEGTGPHGNNGQASFDTINNCSTSNGSLVIHSWPADITNAGYHYDWQSGFLSTKTFKFRYGFFEVRMKCPPQPGFWPAAWTWASPSVPAGAETDVMEVWTARPTLLAISQHNPPGWGRQFAPGGGWNPADWHTYGVDIEPTGTTWYLDGQVIGQTPVTSAAETSLLLDTFVDANALPAPGTHAYTYFDYARVWRH